MLRIQLIVTGDMEKRAMRESLRRFFPEDRGGEEVVWEEPQKVNGITTNRLPEAGDPYGDSRALARTMIAAANRGKKGKPADLVIALDDVELDNFGQESVILRHVKDAFELELRSHDMVTQERYRAFLKKSCSFHLLCPMVESPLFRDPGALRLAGVPAGQHPMLAHPDVEQFESSDPAWLPECARVNGEKAALKSWWREERHAKHYLVHLTERGQVFYDETIQGRDALRALDWSKVPAHAQATPFIGALFQDLADWFGVNNPIQAASDPRLYPARSVRRDTLLLRNM